MISIEAIVGFQNHASVAVVIIFELLYTVVENVNMENEIMTSP